MLKKHVRVTLLHVSLHYTKGLFGGTLGFKVRKDIHATDEARNWHHSESQIGCKQSQLRSHFSSLSYFPTEDQRSKWGLKEAPLGPLVDESSFPWRISLNSLGWAGDFCQVQQDKSLISSKSFCNGINPCHVIMIISGDLYELSHLRPQRIGIWAFWGRNQSKNCMGLNNPLKCNTNEWFGLYIVCYNIPQIITSIQPYHSQLQPSNHATDNFKHTTIPYSITTKQPYHR